MQPGPPDALPDSRPSRGRFPTLHAAPWEPCRGHGGSEPACSVVWCLVPCLGFNVTHMVPPSVASMGRVIMSLPGWSGSRLFQSVWGRLWSLRPIGSADSWRLPPNTPAFGEGSRVGPRGGAQTLLGTWPGHTGFVQSLRAPVIPKGQASGLSSYRAAIRPCRLRVRARRSGPAQGHSAGPECQASHTCPSASGSPTGVWACLVAPPASRAPPSSVIPRAGCVPSLLIPWPAPHLNPQCSAPSTLCSPARPPPRLLGRFPLMICSLSASPSAVLGTLLCDQGGF